MLVRSSGRTREVAVRTALGAGRGRLARQFLTEALLLGLSGGALGVALACAGMKTLRAWLPADLPRVSGDLDRRARARLRVSRLGRRHADLRPRRPPSRWAAPMRGRRCGRARRARERAAAAPAAGSPDRGRDGVLVRAAGGRGAPHPQLREAAGGAARVPAVGRPHGRHVASARPNTPSPNSGSASTRRSSTACSPSRGSRSRRLPCRCRWPAPG